MALGAVSGFANDCFNPKKNEHALLPGRGADGQQPACDAGGSQTPFMSYSSRVGEASPERGRAAATSRLIAIAFGDLSQLLV
jgi:hypothetical protein